MQVSFAEASRAVQKHGFILLGWTETDFTGKAHVVLNPRNHTKVRSLNHSDCLFILGPTPGRESAAFKMRRAGPTTAEPATAEPKESAFKSAVGRLRLGIASAGKASVDKPVNSQRQGLGTI